GRFCIRFIRPSRQDQTEQAQNGLKDGRRKRKGLSGGSHEVAKHGRLRETRAGPPSYHKPTFDSHADRAAPIIWV
ncbi:MAG: hypothetical protein MI861_07340, partial [Pirellulales bacterium]|nr:hypothetical protein [Pirellulales bacterium]